MDDGIDHRVERKVARRCQRALVLRVAEQDVQELVADHGLDVVVGGAVLFHERQIDEQPRPLLARDRHGRHALGELDLQDFQYGANGERVLVDELGEQRAEALRGHA